MYLNSIHLVNFKNHIDHSYTFEKPIICITGKNGVGKTNLVDAIHYLSFTKSNFNTPDQQNIRMGEKFFRLEGIFEAIAQPVKVTCKVPYTGKKEVLSNQVPYDKLADHIGRFPVVMITPYDSELIDGSGEIRRRFLDMLIGQMNANYLQDVMQYNRILSQRNALLRQFGEHQKVNLALLQAINSQLIPVGNRIFATRQSILPELVSWVKKYYALISGDIEQVELIYQSDLNENTFEELLNKSEQRDLLSQRTNEGIHKDDLELLINGKPIRKYGSQGQQKSFLLALKFANLDILKAQLGLCPILIIDDLFDKLDRVRTSAVINLLPSFNQTFITHTESDILSSILNTFNLPFQSIEINR